MEISFNLPHVFNPKASSVDNAFALRALLDGLIQINLGFLQTHSVPELYRSGVRYGRTVIWDSIPGLYKRGYGDCKSLTCAKIAELRMKGIPCEPTFRWKKRGGNGWDISQPNDFHILIQTGTGYIDPSKVLGMGANENEKFYKTDGTVMSWDSGGIYPLT
jgi:hypothetical protein